MKKRIIVILIFLLYLATFIIGCTETNSNIIESDTNNNQNYDFEVIQYSIETYDTGIPWDSDDETFLGEGFITTWYW